MGGKVLLQSHIKIHLVGNIGVNSVDIDLGDQNGKGPPWNLANMWYGKKWIHEENLEPNKWTSF
jgi:hypothetical protein